MLSHVTIFTTISIFVIDIQIAIAIAPSIYKSLESAYNEYTSKKQQYLEYDIRTDEFLKNYIHTKIPSPTDCDDCAICLDEYTCDQIQSEKVVKLECGHIFHQQCIQEWFVSKKRYVCPLCKKDFTLLHNIVMNLNLRMQSQSGVDDVLELNGMTTEEILINLQSNQLQAYYANQDIIDNQMYNYDLYTPIGANDYDNVNHMDSQGSIVNSIVASLSESNSDISLSVRFNQNDTQTNNEENTNTEANHNNILISDEQTHNNYNYIPQDNNNQDLMPDQFLNTNNNKVEFNININLKSVDESVNKSFESANKEYNSAIDQNDNDKIQPIQLYNSIDINDFTNNKQSKNGCINEYDDSVIIEENDIQLAQSNDQQDTNMISESQQETNIQNDQNNKQNLNYNQYKFDADTKQSNNLNSKLDQVKYDVINIPNKNDANITDSPNGNYQQTHFKKDQVIENNKIDSSEVEQF